jgi:hypothetical protein
MKTKDESLAEYSTPGTDRWPQSQDCGGEEKQISSLVSSIKAHFRERPQQAKLTQMTALRNIQPPEAQEAIRALYADLDLNMKFFGRMLNSIFTQKRGTFLFSRPLLEKLMMNDKNRSTRKSVSGEEYDNLMINLGNVFLKRLAHGQKGEHRASIYKLIHPGLVAILKKLVSEETLLAQEEQCLEIFNSYGQKKSKASTKVSMKTSNAFATAIVYESECETQPTVDTSSSFFKSSKKAKEDQGQEASISTFPSLANDQIDPLARFKGSIEDFLDSYDLTTSKNINGLPSLFSDILESSHNLISDSVSNEQIMTDSEFLSVALVSKLKTRFRPNDTNPMWAFNGNFCQSILTACFNAYEEMISNRKILDREALKRSGLATPIVLPNLEFLKSLEEIVI